MEYNKKSLNKIEKPMNNDYLEIENAEGMPGLVDSTIALGEVAIVYHILAPIGYLLLLLLVIRIGRGRC